MNELNIDKLIKQQGGEDKETKRNETKRNETKRNETKRNEMMARKHT